MRRIPKFKSEDEEFEFWSTHSSVEFMDEGEEVEFDVSEARKRRAERLRERVRTCARTFRSAPQGSLESNELYESVAPESVARIEMPEESRQWTWTSRSFATMPSPATR